MVRSKTPFVAIGLVAAVACTGTLDGTVRVHQITDSGDMVTFPQYRIRAITSPDGGSTGSAAGSGDYDAKYIGAMGDWTIDGPAAGLDAGPLFVQYGNLYIATEHRFISLDEYVHGRENVQYVSSTTNVTLALDGLMPWTDDSSLEIYSLDAAADVFAPETTTTPPAAGATSTSFTFDWNLFGYGLPQGGDNVVVTQLVGATAGAFHYNTIGSVYQTTGVSLSNGGSATITGTMTAVPAGTSYNLDIDYDGFAALASQMNPAARSPDVYLDVVAKPGGLSTPVATNMPLPDLAVSKLTANVSMPVMIGNPYPPSWAPYSTVTAYYGVPFIAPGATMPLTLYSRVRDSRAPDGGTLRAWLGPVGHPTIDHADAFQELANVGRTPLLTWDPPTQGTPTAGYRIDIYQLENSNGTTTGSFVAEVMVGSPQVRIPPGVLQTGNAYVFEIIAVDTDHLLETGPYMRSVPYSTASVLTGLVHVNPTR